MAMKEDRCEAVRAAEAHRIEVEKVAEANRLIPDRPLTFGQMKILQSLRQIEEILEQQVNNMTPAEVQRIEMERILASRVDPCVEREAPPRRIVFGIHMPRRGEPEYDSDDAPEDDDCSDDDDDDEGVDESEDDERFEEYDDDDDPIEGAIGILDTWLQKLSNRI